MTQNKILILGASGMLGHKIAQILGYRFRVAGTVRDGAENPALSAIAPQCEQLTGIDPRDGHDLEVAINAVRPNVVINCVGLIKQRPNAEDTVAAIELNALLPHRLSLLANDHAFRLIHFSTDCVFSGESGCYQESDIPDPVDLYGRTKALGEVSGDNGLTLRTSIVGHALKGNFGLIDWFISQQGGGADGFSQAVFSGLPTITLARLVEKIITWHFGLSGLWHVSADPIDKFSLLSKINDIYCLDIDLQESDRVRINRSLDSTAFRRETGWASPNWDALVADMYADYRMGTAVYGRV